MAKKAFDKIMDGLTDALAYAEGDKSRGKAHTVEVPAVDVRAARRKLGLSQDRFAEAFMIPVSTLRKWEQGQRQPQGPAQVLLNVIDREPKAVLRALGRRVDSLSAKQAGTPKTAKTRVPRDGGRTG